MATNENSGLMADRELSQKNQIAKLAREGNRFEILQTFMQHVKPGRARISDTYKVGPANPKKFKLEAAIWRKRVEDAPTDGQCKGIFMAAFHHKQLIRRCDAAAEELCPLCAKIDADVKKLKLRKTQNLENYTGSHLKHH